MIVVKCLLVAGQLTIWLVRCNRSLVI